MDESLQLAVHKELAESGVLDEDWSVLVIAACEDAGMVEDVLGGSAAPAPLFEEAAELRPKGAYLGPLTVQGFRGIGDEVTVDLQPGPGLTLVVGRNGSGKSSFAEALEVLFTGDSKRWAARTKVWKEGWRNLHHARAAQVEAHVFIDGRPSPTVAKRQWADEAALEESTATVKAPSKSPAGLEALEWTEALTAYRPFLSYNELGSMLEGGPSQLYDALAPILGLEDISLAQKALAVARQSRENLRKQAKNDLLPLLEKLRETSEGTNDERARACLDALGEGQAWDLEVLESQLVGGPKDPGAGQQISILQQIATLVAPNPAQIKDASTSLRNAVANVEAVAGTETERASETASILEEVLAFHAAHGDGDCPVCGSADALGAGWRTRSEAQLGELRQAAQAADRAHEELRSAITPARDLIHAPPAALTWCDEVGLDGAPAAQAWGEWAKGKGLQNAPALAAYLEDTAPALCSAVEELKKRAADEAERLQDAWRPVALELTEWLGEAREAERARANVPLIASAEKWLKKAENKFRTERFGPIRDQVIELWKLLRQQSNVRLEDVTLTGSATRRAVDVAITIDGADGSALGVMSQGELHALALSLFLPRATLPQSPFRFLVIDDPVQSMDPSRVDGLARVLEKVARDRQVIVFTHDDRLPEAVRRLNIPATVFGVTRRENSVIEIRTSQDPVTRSLKDARSLAATQELPANVARRVVPGFCRAALEAAFIRMIRARRLAKGIAHADVEDAINESTTLTTLAALALFDDKGRGGDVMTHFNNKYGGWAGDVFMRCKEGPHQGFGGNLHDLVNGTEKLARKLLLT